MTAKVVGQVDITTLEKLLAKQNAKREQVKRDRQRAKSLQDEVAHIHFVGVDK